MQKGVVFKYTTVQEENRALRSAVEETTRACMKSRALLLQYEELSRNPRSLVFKGSQGRKEDALLRCLRNVLDYTSFSYNSGKN